MRGRSRPASIGDLVARFLAKRHGHPERSGEAIALKVFTAFARIGPPITEHAEPTSLRGGVLTLTVADSVWLTELTFLKSEILDRVNRGLSKTAVRDLRMRLGAVKPKPRETVRAPQLTPAEAAMVESWGAMVESVEVREALMRAAAQTLHRPPPRRHLLEGPPGPQPPPRPPKEETKPEPRDRWAKDRDRWKKK